VRLILLALIWIGDIFILFVFGLFCLCLVYSVCVWFIHVPWNLWIEVGHDFCLCLFDHEPWNLWIEVGHDFCLCLFDHEPWNHPPLVIEGTCVMIICRLFIDFVMPWLFILWILQGLETNILLQFSIVLLHMKNCFY